MYYIGVTFLYSLLSTSKQEACIDLTSHITLTRGYPSNNYLLAPCFERERSIFPSQDDADEEYFEGVSNSGIVKGL